MNPRTTRYAHMAAFAGIVFQVATSILSGWDRPPLVDRPVLVAAVIALAVFAIGALLIRGYNAAERS